MKILQIVSFGALSVTALTAGGYKIPEQSINSMALGAAYVAHTSGADTNYYNPANMSFMDDNKSYVEGGVTLAYLPSNDYMLIAPYSGSSETENLPIPFLHYVGKPFGDFRWGMSLTVPGGLTKRWKSAYQKPFAEEFTLKVIEINPNISYKVSDKFSIGGGVRLIYSEGVVKSDARLFGGPVVEMEGDRVAFGYNLAFIYKPAKDINMALTYRSNVDLEEEGIATINGTNMDAKVTIPLPAALNIAVSKTWQERVTLELVYERTFWSEYENLEFVGTPLPVSPKNWKDTDTFRVGATVKMDNKITAMFGFAIDETPVPVDTLGFELPDSDAKIFSMGFRYRQSEHLSWGAAFLYDSKASISMSARVNSNPVLWNGGSFREGGAFLTTVGVSYEY